MNNLYEDIIEMPHHVSQRHPQMSPENRAAQFAPFAALSGHEEALDETSRTTMPQYVMSDEEHKELSRRLTYALSLRHEAHLISFLYFQPDVRKAGGRYLNISGKISKWDEYERKLTLTDGHVLDARYIAGIYGTIFDSMPD